MGMMEPARRTLMIANGSFDLSDFGRLCEYMHGRMRFDETSKVPSAAFDGPGKTRTVAMVTVSVDSCEVSMVSELKDAIRKILKVDDVTIH